MNVGRIEYHIHTMQRITGTMNIVVVGSLRKTLTKKKKKAFRGTVPWSLMRGGGVGVIRPQENE
jgi:hypothetical protein